MTSLIDPDSDCWMWLGSPRPTSVTWIHNGTRKNAALAADFVLFMTGQHVQKERAVQGSYNPTFPALYSDPEILVGHYNPRIAREEIKDDQDSKVGGDVKSFQAGDVHYLVLNPLDGEWTGAVEDEYRARCRPLTLEEWRSRPARTRYVDNVMRLTAALQ